MEMYIQWNRFIRLRNDKKLDYTVDLSKLSNRAGIYIFGRKYRNSFEALYVGKADNIRWRVKGQLNNHRLMQHIKHSKEGPKVILTGLFKAKPGQKQDKCLRLIEQGLIRYFISLGDDLVNVQGMSIRQHLIKSTGKAPRKIIPTRIFIDRK